MDKVGEALAAFGLPPDYFSDAMNKWYGQDPCDDWPVEIWKGHLCLVTEREHGVSPILGYWSKGWRYQVVETSFIPYGVFIETVMIPIYAEEVPHG